MNHIKVFITDDNKEQVSMLTEVIKQQENMIVVGSTFDGGSLLEKLKTIEVDILLLDLVMPYCDGMQVLKKLKENDEYKKPKHIIVISAFYKDSLLTKCSELGASYYLSKPVNVDHLLDLMNGFIKSSVEHKVVDDSEIITPLSENEEMNLQTEIINVLHRLGVPSHIKGFLYLREAIRMVFHEEDLIRSITKTIYPDVARKFKTTSSRVERALRHAIEVVWNRGNVNAIGEIFGYKERIQQVRPENREFIAKVAYNLRIKSA